MEIRCNFRSPVENPINVSITEVGGLALAQRQLLGRLIFVHVSNTFLGRL
jgi:hypothetical protein